MAACRYKISLVSVFLNTQQEISYFHMATLNLHCVLNMN